ncbi:MAG: hypothetical protein JO062_02055 [Bryobacterales bacterium]|nr:hypothetical protein [Bryobacterales bacterium]
MVADEFNHLLIGDTFASGRLTNPAHAFWQHFETIYVLHQPTYTSHYSPGQGFVLALGQVIAGNPWWGVWASTGLMCGAVCWMLGGWLETQWALVGGLVCVFQFGIFSFWMNSYMGGSVAAIGGAMALGALPRLKRTSRAAWAVVLALGLAVVMMTRPYEGLFFSGAVGIFVAVWLLRAASIPIREKIISIVLPVASIALASVAIQGYYNYRVTGNALLMPVQLSMHLYGVPRGLSSKRPAPEPSFRYPELRKVYEWQWTTWTPLKQRIKAFWRFYGGLPLLLGVLFLPLARRSGAFQLIAIGVALAAGQLFYWFFLAHYLAPFTAAWWALIFIGLRALWNWKAIHPRLRHAAVIAVVIAEILLNIKAGIIGVGGLRLFQYSDQREKIEEQLTKEGGRHLVFVHYSPNHNFHIEWVFNSANIDRQSIVWARELDPVSDARLAGHFRDRSIWVADADVMPVRLCRWVSREEQAPAVRANLVYRQPGDRSH